MSKTPSFEELSQYLAIAQTAAELGKEVLLKHFGRLSKIEKKHQAGLVSIADREAEQVITDHLKRETPDASILGEEFGLSNSPNVANPLQWIIDPLDGTTNYVHSLPIFCISIALRVHDKISVALVDCPLMNEQYTALLHHGAYLHQKPLHVSKTNNLSNSLIATGFFPENKVALTEQLGYLNAILPQIQCMRRLGTAAYDLCLVAKGVFDGYWEKNLNPWDTAAGYLIVLEAGGTVTSYQNETYDPEMKTILASNGIIHPSLLRFFNSNQNNAPKPIL